MKLHWLRSGKCEKVRSLAGLWLAGSLVFGMNLQGLSAAAQDMPCLWDDEECAAKGSSGEVPLVALSELTGTPGSTLMMPLYFTPDPNNPLRSVVVDIEYVSNNLDFLKLSLGLAAEQVNADIQSSVTKGPPDAKDLVRSKLHVTVKLPEETAKEGLPDGLLAYLLFQVTLDAKPFAIQMVPTVVSAEDTATPPKQVADVATEPGLVRISVLDVMPEATCFFFSH